MLTKYVGSRHIEEIAYDESTMTLLVAFSRGNARYEYYGVGKFTAVDLMRENDPYHYFIDHIKNQYRYKRV